MDTLAKYSFVKNTEVYKEMLSAGQSITNFIDDLVQNYEFSFPVYVPTG